MQLTPSNDAERAVVDSAKRKDERSQGRQPVTITVIEAEEMTHEELEAWVKRYVRAVMESDAKQPRQPRTTSDG